MNQKQTHKALYIVSFFSLMSFLSMALTLPYVWGIVLFSRYILITGILCFIADIMLILAPFVRKNIFVFLILIPIYINSLPHLLMGIYQHIFLSSFGYITVGFVPGFFTACSYALSGLSGLIVLCLRSYGYYKERRAGLTVGF